jgi:sugar-specific transcriptional regulator TrmB
MTGPDTDDPREQAVEQLTELGLGLYAARTFVALTVLSGGTAVEVSRTADVPRTRVYDAAEELAEWNLVDIADTTPQEFSPVDSDEAAARFLEEYQDRIETFRAALSALGDGRPRSEN